MMENQPSTRLFTFEIDEHTLRMAKTGLLLASIPAGILGCFRMSLIVSDSSADM
jgi:hypothetical protein